MVQFVRALDSGVWTRRCCCLARVEMKAPVHEMDPSEAAGNHPFEVQRTRQKKNLPRMNNPNQQSLLLKLHRRANSKIVQRSLAHTIRQPRQVIHKLQPNTPNGAANNSKFLLLSHLPRVMVQQRPAGPKQLGRPHGIDSEIVQHVVRARPRHVGKSGRVARVGNHHVELGDACFLLETGGERGGGDLGVLLVEEERDEFAAACWVGGWFGGVQWLAGGGDDGCVGALEEGGGDAGADSCGCRVSQAWMRVDRD